MPFIDLHCDTIGVISHKKELSLKDANLQINAKYLKEANFYLQCFAMFIPYIVDNPFEECINMIDVFYEEISKNDELVFAYSYEDIINNHNKGKISALLTIEEGGTTKCNLSFLNTFYRLGVRMICLNWNYENGVGYPNYGKYIDGKPDYKTPNIKNGLTEYGFKMIKRMNELGIIIDVSHLSDKGFWDVINTSTKPIVASHSNARSVCSHVRNLTDEMIIALHKNGGVMGINYCADFLDNDEEKGKKTIECVIRHIKHIKKIASIDVVALGSDFDGIDPRIELENAQKLSLLKEALEKEFTIEEVEKITYKNALRVFKAVL
ncbi:MAG: dipeptidase [Anaeroplasma sp.]